jgi:7,8-dihydropterin-6-yl-methyl-4-(beta-D-ribofuranosyl)aminobenzene 5'-phosphate synthase
MKIITLVENTSDNADLKKQHGLSVYIETPQHKILFDLGSDDTFLYNAQKLGINLKAVDTVIISHGHKDHGGGLSGFLKMNDIAKIYVHQQAFEPYYIKVLFTKIPVGLSPDLLKSERFIPLNGNIHIDDELFVFSDVDGYSNSKSNRALFKKISDVFVNDDFAHEQNLIVTAEDKVGLFTGCSHRGIKNIYSTAQKHQPNIRAVFGGFHLYNPVTKVNEPKEVTQHLADWLSVQDTSFYTGHCTGRKAFACMKNITGEKLQYLSTGTIIDL